MTGTGAKPFVSVIIPTFNRGWILKEAVESVLAQEYRDFELLVIDDGSTDDTLGLLRGYGERLTLIRQQNRGVSAARNRGIAAASGRYVAFLDSDDLWLPQKLVQQAAFFERHPASQICQTQEIWVRDGRRINPKRRHQKPSGMIFEASLQLCLVSPSAVMVRRSLFETVGLFDETLPACEDYDLWLRVGCRYPVHLIAAPLVIKRGGHADQLSKTPGLDKYRIRSLAKLLESGLLLPNQAAAAIKVLKEKCAIYAGGCLQRGKMAEASYYNRLARRFDGRALACGNMR